MVYLKTRVNYLVAFEKPSFMTTATSFRIKQMSLQLIVANIEHSIEFYTTKLGFDIDFRYEGFYAGLVKDSYSIHLKTGKPSIEEGINKKNNEAVDIIFSVDGIEDLHKDFLSKSVNFIQSLRTMPYGKEFYIADPDGYIIGFLEVG